MTGGLLCAEKQPIIHISLAINTLEIACFIKNVGVGGLS